MKLAELTGPTSMRFMSSFIPALVATALVFATPAGELFGVFLYQHARRNTAASTPPDRASSLTASASPLNRESLF